MESLEDKHPEVQPDLSRADLRSPSQKRQFQKGALRKLDLRGVNLSGADSAKPP